jgi:hypothetical protein
VVIYEYATAKYESCDTKYSIYEEMMAVFDELRIYRMKTVVGDFSCETVSKQQLGTRFYVKLVSLIYL